MFFLEQIKFNSHGLVPAIAQQFDSKDVLMLAWMNKEAIQETLQTQQVCYWSRSRQSLWRKGETSGHIQKLKTLRYDCDKDAILLMVDQIGAACHTNRPNCFFYAVNQQLNKIDIISEPIA